MQVTCATPLQLRVSEEAGEWKVRQTGRPGQVSRRATVLQGLRQCPRSLEFLTIIEPVPARLRDAATGSARYGRQSNVFLDRLGRISAAGVAGVKKPPSKN